MPIRYIPRVIPERYPGQSFEEYIEELHEISKSVEKDLERVQKHTNEVNCLFMCALISMAVLALCILFKIILN